MVASHGVLCLTACGSYVGTTDTEYYNFSKVTDEHLVLWTRVSALQMNLKINMVFDANVSYRTGPVGNIR